MQITCIEVLNLSVIIIFNVKCGGLYYLSPRGIKACNLAMNVAGY